QRLLSVPTGGQGLAQGVLKLRGHGVQDVLESSRAELLLKLFAGDQEPDPLDLRDHHFPKDLPTDWRRDWAGCDLRDPPSWLPPDAAAYWQELGMPAPLSAP